MMSFDLPATVERDLESYAKAAHISPKEAAVQLLNEILKSKKKNSAKVLPVTDAEINQLKKLNPLFGLLEDVPEDQIDRMAASIRSTKREKFPNIA